MAAGWVGDGYGPKWPNSEGSQLVDAAGLRWHVQVYGQGPPALLVHGTAAATHSWRGFGPQLAQRYTVVVPDLPGHGFSSPSPRALQELRGLGQGLAVMLEALGVSPQVVVGHSFGAALLARMALDRYIDPQVLVSLNGAFLPFSGLAGHLFPAAARLLTYNPLIPYWIAFRARNRLFLADVLARTGSRIDPEGVELYQSLATSPTHVGAALNLMARSHDDLHALAHELPALATPLVLFAAERDRTVPPAQAERVRFRLPSARVEMLSGLGHLAHEEDPEGVARRVVEAIETAAPKGRGAVMAR